VEKLNVGDPVTDFELPDQDGQPWRLSQALAEGPVTLFFYPAAMTGGCTAESCHFRDLAADFQSVGAQRVGISADPVAKQKQFAELNHFDYPLLSDVGAVVADQFGVKRGRVGTRLGLPVKRVTFVIGTDQRVSAVIASETNMASHADEALAVLRRS
jgi:thioredoxin-dependent peroxiredoxin